MQAENGDEVIIVSDMPFVDALITATGKVLPLSTPPGFFEKHEAEREVERERAREREREVQKDKDLPVLDKAQLIFELAQYGN